MQLLHPSLAWAFLLIAVPPLIHLINLLRHRRVKWAAMDFLLASYRRHSNWVRFKQVVLLLLRMAAIALVVAMLAQLISPDQWSSLLGTSQTHHFVLLDDSYSMSERDGTARVYDRALRVLQSVGHHAAKQQGNHRITVLTTSEAASQAGIKSPAEGKSTGSQSNPGDSQVSSIHTFETQISGTEAFDIWFEDLRPRLTITQLGNGPRAALEVLRELLPADSSEKSIVYVVSDFRAREWNQPDPLRNALENLQQAGAEIFFVACVEQQRTNLAIKDLSIHRGTIAAGVPFQAAIEIANHGDREVSNVKLQVQSKYYSYEQEQGVAPEELSPEINQLVVEPIASIGPGQSVVRTVEVFFPKPGKHVLEARLPEDCVATDNHRYCVVHLPADVPVLVIDGDPQKQAAAFVSAVFEPGTHSRTGIRREIQDVSFLRAIDPSKLETYHAIYLLNVPRLDISAVDALKNYVHRGGGLAIFLGPLAQLDFYNQLHDEGRGLFPLPLAQHDLLLPDLNPSSPDVLVGNHPLFRIFSGKQNPFLNGVSVEHYLRTTDDWHPSPQSGTQILAELRNGQPLCVERRLGAGVVVAFLTSVTPEWNNWARNPSFVVVLLDLQAYIGSKRSFPLTRLVGTPIEVEIGAAEHQPELSFVLPKQEISARPTLQVQATPLPEQAGVLRAALGRNRPLGHRNRMTETSGIYECWKTTLAGDVEVSRYALNVDPSEADLQLVTPQALASGLDSVEIQQRSWDQFDVGSANQAGFNWSGLLMGILILVLLTEQMMAYVTSYHVTGRGRSI